MMDWGKWAFGIAIIDFVILVVMGLEFGKRFKIQKKQQMTFYDELRTDLNEATGEGIIKRAHRRGQI